MLSNIEAAERVVEAAVQAATSSSPESLGGILDEIPAAIYLTDPEGTITHYNRACVELAGRTPAVGRDKWCVSWKIYTPEGDFLPHDQCPMAEALRERKPIRNVEAVAERPDGTRVNFLPFPTPLFDDAGNLIGAVNLLVDVTEERKPDYLREQAQRCRRLALGIGDQGVVDTLSLMAAKYDEQALRFARASEDRGG